MPLLTYTHRREGITRDWLPCHKKINHVCFRRFVLDKPSTDCCLSAWPTIKIFLFIFIQGLDCSGIHLLASFSASCRQALLVPFSSLPTLHQKKVQSLGSQSSKHLKCEFYLGLALLKALRQLRFSQMSSFHVLSWALIPFLLGVCWINSQITVEAKGTQFTFWLNLTAS